MRMFATGHAAVPARGMQKIPEQLAAGLPPGALRLETRVTALEGDTVHLADGSRLTARRIVVATDGSAAATLLRTGAHAPAWRSVTCLYYAAPASPLGGDATLVLNGSGVGRVNNVAVMSDVSPDYAPAGQSLVSVSILGVPDDDDAALGVAVQAELGTWFGAAVTEWRLLRTYHVEQGLPVRMPLVREPATPVRPGVWAAGDFRSSPSIQGAMEHGEAVADAILTASKA